MPPRLPLFALLLAACGSEPATEPPITEDITISGGGIANSPNVGLKPVQADDCEAVCRRIQEHCGLDHWSTEGSPLFCFMTCESGKDGAAKTKAQAACAAEASDCAAVEACITDTSPMDAWIVILGGSVDKHDAERLQKAYQDAGGPEWGPYPQLLPSAEIEGLNPGFWIVVTAIHAELGTANALRDHLRSLSLTDADTSGTYVKAVKHDDPMGQTLETLSEDGWKAIIIWQATTETSEDWAWFTGDVETAAKAAGITVVWGGDSEQVKLEVGEGQETTVNLKGVPEAPVGYVFARAGSEPLFVQHDMADSVLRSASSYFGVEIAR